MQEFILSALPLAKKVLLSSSKNILSCDFLSDVNLKLFVQAREGGVRASRERGGRKETARAGGETSSRGRGKNGQKETH